MALSRLRQVQALLGLSLLSSLFIIFDLQNASISKILPQEAMTILTGQPETSAAICAIAKHEELYLDEFVDYHLALGFSNIFVYDNSETFDMKDWAEERRPAVEAIHYPGGGMQMMAYLDCAKTVAAKHTWIAYFDIDEFLVLKKHKNAVDFFEEYVQEGALAINWRVFGTGNHREYRAEPVTMRFKFRVFDHEDKNEHVKVVVKTEDMSLEQPMPTPHSIVLKDSMVTVATNGDVVDGPFNKNADYSVAALHHYHYKSYKEYIFKRERGRGDVAGVQEELVRLAKEGRNPAGTIFDDSAWQTLKRLVPEYELYEDHKETPSNASGSFW